MGTNTKYSIEILRNHFVSTSYHSSMCVDNTIEDVVELFVSQAIKNEVSTHNIKLIINNIDIEDFTERFLIIINSKPCSCGKSGLVN